MKILRRKHVVVLTMVTLTLVAAGTLYASSGHVEGPVFWGIPVSKWKDLLWRTLNFAALVVILVKFLGKPIANVLHARQISIKEQFEDLEARKAEAEKTYKEFENKLTEIDQEASSIIERAIAQGEAERVRIIEEANRAADDIKRQAEMAIQYEIAQAKMQLREEVANQAVAMAEELIAKNLQKEDQVKLIDDYLDKVGAIQ
jgi:F-type H+-transporting ATPase subunit b